MQAQNLSYPERNFAWSVAVFSSRETVAELLVSIQAVLAATRKPSLIDLLINGNESLARNFCEHIDSIRGGKKGSVVRVWDIALGDKANAWNQYVHVLWPAGKIVFFLDGYVRPDPDSLSFLEAGMQSAPEALGATGIPRSGKSAIKLRKQMLEKGGIHGNMYCLSGETMANIKRKSFHLPLGIYRTDSILGAALKFNLDPANNEWDPARIQVNPDSGWDTKPKRWWRLSDIKSHMKRVFLQSRGDLENRAFRHSFAIKKASLAELPETAAEMVLNWAKSCPDDVDLIIRRNVFSRWALKKFKQPRDWGAAKSVPQLICELEVS